VEWLTVFNAGPFETALIIALLFLLFGLFIDAIPTIIILGTVLAPVAAGADIHPVTFAIIGIISLAFGLVTPPYGLCLLIASSIGGLNVVQVLRDVVIILVLQMKRLPSYDPSMTGTLIYRDLWWELDCVGLR